MSIMSRKAQVAGQVFIYVLAVIVVSLIIVYGYSAIKGFGEKSEQVAYATLQTDMKNAVRAIISDYGSIKRPNLPIPGKYTDICIVDLNQKSVAENNAVELCMTGLPDYEPLACEGWKIGRNNVFLIPDGSDSFNIGEVTLKGTSYICFPVVNGKISMQMKSFGDHVELSSY